jgi:nucleotide-binding universal stress UspA family protein
MPDPLAEILMYKKILVPVDGSATSRRGLEEAIRLAQSGGASLRLVHVVDAFLMESPYAPTFDYQGFLSSVRENGSQLLQDMLAQARARGVQAESELIETVGGRAADKIIESANHWHADLIVMGTHGRRGVLRLLMGSDAELVLRTSPVPVLMIRAAAADEK